VWQWLPQGAKIPPQRDAQWGQQILEALGPAWKPSGPMRQYPVRTYELWRQHGEFRRWEYLRDPAVVKAAADP
jgi:hypothetical protein